MFEKLILYTITVLLTTAVFTPLVVDLLELTEDISVLSEVGEEDQKEAEKEFEIKNLFFGIKQHIENICIANLQSTITDYYLVRASLFKSEVVSPPPKHVLQLISRIV